MLWAEVKEKQRNRENNQEVHTTNMAAKYQIRRPLEHPDFLLGRTTLLLRILRLLQKIQ